MVPPFIKTTPWKATILKRTTAIVVALLTGTPLHSLADRGDDPTRALTVQCSYSERNGAQEEEVIIRGGIVGDEGEATESKIFTREADSERSTLIVPVGKYAECVFPSGNKVRVKVAEGEARAYGMCGADPEVYGSIWVNERKMASRAWFAGHCWEESDEPNISFRVSWRGGQEIAQTCHTARSVAAKSEGNGLKVKPIPACVNSDVNLLPQDELEYPGQGRTAPFVGEVELLAGSDPVCKAVQEELARDFSLFDFYAGLRTEKFQIPLWSESPSSLPKMMRGSDESIFDFNNDGNLDRVIAKDFSSGYLDGTVMLVDSGGESKKLSVSSAPSEVSSWLIPCQLDSVKYMTLNCPPFSSDNSEAGFTIMTGEKDKSVFFRARYTKVFPFISNGESFIGVSSRSEGTKDYAAVLKPTPRQTFEPACLFRKVGENL